MAKQKKLSVSFKENEIDLKLYKWILEKSKVIGPSNKIKEILFAAMEKEEK